MGSVFKRGGTWYVKWKDGLGAWQYKASTAKTKGAAQGLVHELERKAERQRLGLEPLPTDCKLTLAELCEWWLKERCPERSRASERSRLTKHIVSQPIGLLQVKAVTGAAVDEHLRVIERQGGRGASPASLNHLRKSLRAAFTKAIKARIWVGPNPIDDVERRQVIRRAHNVLRVEEVPVLLRNVATAWRDLFATALYTALRKGELLGLQKADVDMELRIIIVRHSYDRDTTKGGRVEAIPIAEPLLPYLRSAIERGDSAFVFPGPEGAMRSRHAKLEAILRRALVGGRLVEGWEHICRWCKAAHKAEHAWRFPDDQLRRCPTCDKKLWARGLPRKMRFHDLRHSTATLLLRAGVRPQHVQRIVRHADISTTVDIYGHLDVEDLRGAMEKIAPILATDGAGLVQEPEYGSAPAEAEAEKLPDSAVLPEWARRESNPRPLASEANALSS